MELGEKLRQARIEAGLTQRQLCGEEITRNMLSLIENGSAKPSMGTLTYLAGRLGKPVSFFLDEAAVVSPNREVMESARRLYDAGEYAQGLLVLEAAECLEKGMAVENVIDRLKELRKHQLGAFVIRTLEYLRKGGRIGLVEGVVGSLLQIKPVIYVNDDGVYATLVKARGFAKALSAMQEEFFKRFQGRKVRVAIVHGQAQEDAQRLLELFCSKLNVASAFVAPVSPALAIHTGPGLLGAIVQFAD